MKKIFIVSLLFIHFSNAQTEFKVDFDYANFHYNDSLSYLEIYYSFYQSLFNQLTDENSALIIKGTLEVVITNSADQSVVVDRDYQFSSPVDTSAAGRDKGFTGVLNYVLPFGDYTCKLTGKDLSTENRQDSTTFSVNIKKPSVDRFSLSDIELASSIKEAEADSGMFYKNTYEVVPNPASVFGGLMPVIFFYSEIYNINVDPGVEKLKVDNILLNASEQIFYKKSKVVPRTNASIVEVGTINVSKAPSGAYTLIVAVTDSLKNLSVYSSKRLYIYNPGVADSTVISGQEGNAFSSEFTIMSNEELDETFAISRYIATDSEQDQWKKLTTEDAKRKYLFNFWNSRDKNTSTPQNEYKSEYFSRVKTANERYTTIQKKGWKTDRGRVLITYGEPSEIERYPNQVDTKPYEIWKYEQLEGGTIFVFADLSGFNDYVLIHSTMRGELRDDLWMRQVRT